ncbi:MAG: thiolase family protein [Cognatishimia sp.]|uniref:thiolase family protein n=1 Tax=Cognatishimia sp. TaxID=2211648 RepID=UPI004059F5C4
MPGLFPSDLPETRMPVIIAAKRTPIGKAGGALAEIALEDLVAPVLAHLAEGLQGTAVDDVILGNATGGGGNIARLAALQAGLGVDVAGVTVDRQCGSGLEAIMLACNLIAAGAGEIYLAGGVESTSRAPIRAHRPLDPDAPAIPYSRARFAPDHIGDPDMGLAAENVAQRYGISRARADGFALQSHRRAVAAQLRGCFDTEILPLGDVASDECPRATTSPQKLASLPPVFRDDGVVTAGNACPLNDGAAVVVVTSRAKAKEMGAASWIAFAGGATAGVDPNYLGIGPVMSTRKLLAKAPELAPAEAKLIEFNEAFATQVLASADELGIDQTRLNRDGGAIALGHPFGASGAILVTRLLHQFRAMGQAAEPGDLALAMMGIGGGMGLTATFRFEVSS